MGARNEIRIGADDRYNGMIMYRKVNNAPFNPQYFFDENDQLTLDSNITVNYIEYYRNSNGAIVNELTKYKNYVVANITDWPAANNWFDSFARTPITAPTGIMDAIEATLLGMPIDVPNGYVLRTNN